MIANAITRQIDWDSIDVTQLVQHGLIHYFEVYGSKVIDFNSDFSAFQSLGKLIGEDKA